MVVGVGVVTTIEIISTASSVVEILPSTGSSPTSMTTRDVAMIGLPGRSKPSTAAPIRRVSRSVVDMETGTSRYADTPMLPS